jgi:hypothetical protein
VIGSFVMQRRPKRGKKPDQGDASRHKQDFNLRLLEMPAISFTPQTRS